MPGHDVRYQIEVDFLDAANGAKERVTLPDGMTLKIEIPSRLRDGQVLRLKGRGMPGLNQAPAGDAYVKVTVRPHKQFKRVGNDIHVTLPISVSEAVNGGSVSVSTISGPVKLTIPKGLNTGQILRLRGKGIIPSDEKLRGDQLVHLSVVLPDVIDQELEKFVKSWSELYAYDPRKKMDTVS